MRYDIVNVLFYLLFIQKLDVPVTFAVIEIKNKQATGLKKSCFYLKSPINSLLIVLFERCRIFQW